MVVEYAMLADFVLQAPLQLMEAGLATLVDIALQAPLPPLEQDPAILEGTAFQVPLLLTEVQEGSVAPTVSLVWVQE